MTKICNPVPSFSSSYLVAFCFLIWTKYCTTTEW